MQCASLPGLCFRLKGKGRQIGAFRLRVDRFRVWVAKGVQDIYTLAFPCRASLGGVSAMHAHVHRPCCQLQQARPLARCCRQVRSVNRRDILVSTVSLVSAAEAVASETEPGASPEGAAAAAAADSLAGGLAAAAAATRAAKPQKKKSKGKARAKAALKPPGIVPKVKLADNLAVSKVSRVCCHTPKADRHREAVIILIASVDVSALCINCQRVLLTLLYCR